MLRRTPRSTLFPYTMLFRSTGRQRLARSRDSRRLSADAGAGDGNLLESREDRKSTRLNSSHTVISYAVFCLKKKNICLGEQFDEQAVCQEGVGAGRHNLADH